MRKFLFVFGAVALLASCSQDNDSVDTPSAKMREVTFDVKSSHFDIEVTPLEAEERSARVDASFPDYYGSHFLQFVVYNEAGDVYSNEITGASSFKDLVKAGAITKTLPEGNYHVAVLAGKCGNPQLPLFYYIKPENYFTDYYYPNSSPSSANRGNENSFYETFDLTVSAQNEAKSIDLNPMWSRVTFNVKNQKNIEIPEGTGLVVVYMDPVLKGYSISTKKSKALPRMPEGFYPDINLMSFQGSAEEFLAAEYIGGTFYAAASDDKTGLHVSFFEDAWSLKFLKAQELGEVAIPENGKLYKVSGSVPANIVSGDIGFSITINENLPEDVVEVPFDME